MFIPGPFFNASRNVYGEQGIADILIQNELGWDVATVGNHEFDAGPRTFATLIAPDADIQGVGIDPNTGYAGTAFPYLATNLDYSTMAILLVILRFISMEFEEASVQKKPTWATSRLMPISGTLVNMA